MDRRRALMSAHIGTDKPIAPPEPIIDINSYLTIEALEPIVIKFTGDGCEYCVNGDGNWATYNANESIEIPRRRYVSFRGNITPKVIVGIGSFNIGGKCNLKGNCMSMLFGDNAANNYSLSGKDYAFSNLFNGCYNIVSVSDNFLPATTLTENCYNSMFSDCTGLTEAPELPATTLTENCYNSMFSGCTSLVASPALLATKLADGCYYGMFSGTNVLPDCSNINFDNIGVVSTRGLRGLFFGTKVTDSDLSRILPKNENGKYYLPATTLANYCYEYMFYGCTSLTTAPELPATTLKLYCYNSMFHHCTSLNSIKMLATDISAYGCLSRWVEDVASTGTFVKNPAMNSLPTGSSGIPGGWAVVNNGEE